MRTLSADHARRLVLTAQGLDRPRPAPGVRRTRAHLERVLDRLDVVQLDTVNVLVRAHEMPFWSRLGAHDRAARDRWLWRSPTTYEGWIHEASVGPTALWPLLAHRRAEHASSRHALAFEREHPGELDRVAAEVDEHGPLSIRDLTAPGERTGPWWGIPRGRRALDLLALAGRIAIAWRTDAFVTVYDATKRVIPAAVRRLDAGDEADQRAALVLRAARTLGIATAHDLADLHRQKVTPVRAALARLVSTGALEEVRVHGWGDEPAYLVPAARAARRTEAATLVSPFDPLVFDRRRTERVFGFRYRIEIYTPATERIHGYYVLPFLMGEAIVARVDVKALRREGRLAVLAAHPEPGIDRTAVARALASELTAMATWLGLTSVSVERRGDLADALGRALG